MKPKKKLLTQTLGFAVDPTIYSTVEQIAEFDGLNKTDYLRNLVMQDIASRLQPNTLSKSTITNNYYINCDIKQANDYKSSSFRKSRNSYKSSIDMPILDNDADMW